MYSHCGFLGINRSSKTDCSASSHDTLYECDGILGTSVRSTRVACSTETEDADNTLMKKDDLTKDLDKDVKKNTQEQAFDSMMNAFRKHNDTFELSNVQDRFCAHVEHELSSVCDSIPFCTKMTEEEQQQRGSASTQRCGNPVVTELSKFRAFESTLKPTEEQTERMEELDAALKPLDISQSAFTADACNYIPHDATGKRDFRNTHGSCQVYACVRHVPGLRQLCLDASKTPDDFRALFDSVQ